MDCGAKLLKECISHCSGLFVLELALRIFVYFLYLTPIIQLLHWLNGYGCAGASIWMPLWHVVLILGDDHDSS